MVTGPTWDDYVTGTTQAAAEAYRLGWAAGYWESHKAAQDARRAALVARAGVEGINVLRARQRAAERTGEGPALGWSA